MAAAFSESLALHPAVVAVAGDELDPEFQASVEGGQVAPRGSEVIHERAPRAGAVDAEIRAVQRGEIGHPEALGRDDQRGIGQIGPGKLRQDLAHSRHIGQTRFDDGVGAALQTGKQSQAAALVGGNAPLR
jgi:hypothetical protein